MQWNTLAAKACRNERLSNEEAAAILNCPEDQILALVDAAYQARRQFFGKRVKLNFLLNAKSGLCPEDCFYCSQSRISNAAIDQYPFLSEAEIVAAAGRAVELRAARFCMVNSGRGPTDGEIERISSAVARVRQVHPQLEICVCMGLLKPEQAQALKSCGVDAYNHNLNTSENNYGRICSTHSYRDRLKTVQYAKDAGLSSCSGCLFGMGESNEDIAQLAFTVRETGVDSIPVNFLIPIPGTPLQDFRNLDPLKCLKILCLFRLTNPSSELRIAGGREVNLRWMQPLGLFIANSIFIGDYLTTKGQKPDADLAMIRDLGFEIAGPQGALQKEIESASVGAQDEFAVRLK